MKLWLLGFLFLSLNPLMAADFLEKMPKSAPTFFPQKSIVRTYSLQVLKPSKLKTFAKKVGIYEPVYKLLALDNGSAVFGSIAHSQNYGFGKAKILNHEQMLNFFKPKKDNDPMIFNVILSDEGIFLSKGSKLEEMTNMVPKTHFAGKLIIDTDDELNLKDLPENRSDENSLKAALCFMMNFFPRMTSVVHNERQSFRENDLLDCGHGESNW